MVGWRRWAWWGVWLIGAGFGGAQRSSWQAMAALVVGALVGAAWQVLRRRDRGPVTLDLVHAPDEVDSADVHHRGAGRRAEA